MKFGPMKAHRRNTLLLLAALVAALGGALAFTLLALRENINLYQTPLQIVSGEAPVGQLIRAGGMVEAGSLVRQPHSLAVAFVISDLQGAAVTVQYDGILPDLFREGQGVVVHGRLDSQGLFQAERVLAKHDENYMPPEVAATLSEAQERAEAQKRAEAQERAEAQQQEEPSKGAAE